MRFQNQGLARRLGKLSKDRQYIGKDGERQGDIVAVLDCCFVRQIALRDGDAGHGMVCINQLSNLYEVTVVLDAVDKDCATMACQSA